MSTPSVVVVGVDEAGRGPVVGDMFVACVAVYEDDLPKLAALGVRDSKAMTREAREKLFPSIVSVARSVVVTRATPREIDSTNLNTLFLEKCVRALTKILRILRPTKARVFIDAAGDVRRARVFIEAKLADLVPELDVVAEHGADARYPVVSAASVVAKVLRDWHVDQLKRVYGDFGSGYPSDPRTRRWLEEVVKRGCVPPIVRRSWSTYRRIASRDLLSFVEKR